MDVRHRAGLATVSSVLIKVDRSADHLTNVGHVDIGKSEIGYGRSPKSIFASADLRKRLRPGSL